MLGKSVTILLPDDHRDEEPRILERIRRGERVTPYETVRRRKDGSLIDISLTVSPVRDSAGRERGGQPELLSGRSNVPDRGAAEALNVCRLRRNYCGTSNSCNGPSGAEADQHRLDACLREI